MKRRAGSSLRVQYVVILLFVAALVAVLVWRRSVLMSTIVNRVASSGIRRGPAVAHAVADMDNHQYDINVNEPVFSINVTAEQYPSLAEFLRKPSGVYHGVGFETISADKPRAYLLHHLIDEHDCAEIVRVAADQMARSEVVHNPGDSGVSPIRTSYGMFILSPLEADLRMRERIAAIAGVPKQNIEATQVLRYHAGQFYRPHPDYFYANAKEHLARGGQRIATSLTWLNKIDQGGETSFPYAQPKPITLRQSGVGDSVFFYSVDVLGNVDRCSMHEAIPPQNQSMKWVAVNWIRQREFR